MAYKENENTRTIVVQLSLDSGGGTTKFMARVLRENNGKSTSDIILLTESYGIKNTFKDLKITFECYTIEIATLLVEGILVSEQYYEVQFYLLGI